LKYLVSTACPIFHENLKTKTKCEMGEGDSNLDFLPRDNYAIPYKYNTLSISTIFNQTSIIAIL
jgi:hypothetical protein